MSAGDGSVANLQIKGARLVCIVHDDQQLLGWIAADESEERVIAKNVNQFSTAKGGMPLPQMKKRADVRENLAFGARAAGSSKGVTRVARKAARKVAAVVGI